MKIWRSVLIVTVTVVVVFLFTNAARDFVTYTKQKSDPNKELTRKQKIYKHCVEVCEGAQYVDRVIVSLYQSDVSCVCVFTGKDRQL